MEPAIVKRCRCFQFAKFALGEPAENEVFEFDLLTPPPDSDDAWSTAQRQQTTDATGLVEIELPVGATFRYRWAPRGAWKKFLVPDATEFRLPQVNDGK